MRNIVLLFVVVSLVTLGVAAVSAQGQENLYGLTPTEALENRHPQVPVEVATYFVNNPTACGVRGPNAKFHANMPKINFARSGGWGNSFSIDTGKQVFVIGGRGVAGYCAIPIAAVPGAEQIVMTELCGFRGDGVTPRVRTNHPDWGNASSDLVDGVISLGGRGVGGFCTLTGADAELAFSLIPKFNR